MNSKYGDPFDGEKVSQLTTSFPPESESESEAEDQHREPGEPGTSMPVMDASLLTSVPHPPMMTPMSVVPRPLASTPNSASRPPTKLRRIEPKPLPGADTPIAQATVPAAAVASSQAMTMPLTFVTVPQVPQQFHIQPTLQQQQLQAPPLQLQHQPIQIQQSPLQQPPQIAGQHGQAHNPAGVHTAVMQSPPSIHIEISPQQQAQLLSPVQLPTPPIQPPALAQPQPPAPAQQQQASQHPQHTSTSKKEERRKEKHKNHHNHHEV